MKKAASVLALAVALASCGGSGSGGSTSGTPAPAPVPPPPPPPPPPAPTYTKYLQLTGDQNFKTACTSMTLSGGPVVVGPATAFGDGLSLAYTGATSTYAVTGLGGVNSTFGFAEAVAAPPGIQTYARIVNGFQEAFTISGANLEYARGFGLKAAVTGQGPMQYQCAFGVPTLVTDRPAGSNIPFTRTGMVGTAYLTSNGVTKPYSLQGSTATIAANLTNGIVTVTLDLQGVEQSPSGPVGGPVVIGSFVGNGAIDEVKGSYTGTFTQGGTPINGSFGGWFFGPEGAEVLMAVSLNFPTTSGTGAVMANVGGLR